MNILKKHSRIGNKGCVFSHAVIDRVNAGVQKAEQLISLQLNALDKQIGDSICKDVIHDDGPWNLR